MKNMCVAGRPISEVIDNMPKNVASASGSGSTAEGSQPEAYHFRSPGGPAALVVRTAENEPGTTVPIDDVSEAFKLTLKVLYEEIKHLGRLSVVVTQSKQDSWHLEQRLISGTVSDEHAHQWIVSGFGADEIVKAAACNGVCRHNPYPGKILKIPSVQEDSRTRDSWYSKNGLRAYCGIRFTSLPECTLCVLWVVDPPDSSVLDEAEVILRGLFESVDNITSKIVRKLVDLEALKDAENKVAEQEKQQQYMSHELKNQLVPLMMLIESGMDVHPDLLSNSLNTVCSILKNPSGAALKLTPNWEMANCFQWFENLCQFSKQMVRRPEVKFTYFYESKEAKELELRIDTSKLRQMIVNIISNAKKFTDQGSIHFSMCVTAPSPPGADNEMDVELKVTDTGCGIHGDDVDRVTKLFVQVGTPESRRNGIGMGLAVAKTIAESIHGGRLLIESTVGKGTTVSVAFRCQSHLPSQSVS